MKNAMKKLTSLLLVAVLLVGMIPFAASAEEAPAAPLLILHVNGVEVNRVEGSVGSVAGYADCLAVAGVDLSAVKVTDASWKKHGGEWAPLSNGVVLDEAAYYYAYIETAAIAPDADVAPQPTEPQATEPQPTEPQATEPAVFALSIDVNGVQKVLTSGTSASYENCLAAAGIDTTKVKVTEAVYQYTAADGRIPNYNFGPGDVITLTADTRVYFFTENVKPEESKPVEDANAWTVTFIDVNGNTIRTAKVAKNGNISTDDLKLAAMSAGTKSGHSFYGWYYNNTTTAYTNDQLSLIPVGGDLILKAAFTQNANKLNNYQVYLHIYNNTMIGSPDKQLNITTGLALDGVVTLTEVKSLVMNYYSAKNSYGIGFDGLYPGVGNWALNYVMDQKYDQLSVVEADRTSDVVIKVMISNANAKGSANADKSNPKTGDSIYSAMTVMGLSAATLATVMFFYNKKRYTV